MELFLPDVDYKANNLTSAGQIKKIFEESSEVAEALVTGDYVNAIRETLDTIQTGYTMLDILLNEWEEEYGSPCPLSRFLSEHNEKLKKKGYLKQETFTPSSYKDPPY